jgi:hypothetical protein
MGKARYALAGIALLVAAPLVGVGCGGDPAHQYCDALCNCGTCPDDYYDNCIDAIERSRDAADKIGCGAELDGYLGCQSDALDSCNAGQLEACNDELNNFVECSGQPQPG